VSELEPIHNSRHIDVGKYQCDVYSTFKNCNGLVSVSCLDRNKSRIFYNLNGEQPEKPVVLDHQHNRRLLIHSVPQGGPKEDRSKM